MTTKNVQLKTLAGDIINPRTRASLVFNTSNQNLGDVEHGAEVNIIEGIKVNGADLLASARAIDVEIATHAEYDIAEGEVAAGYLSAFQLRKSGTPVATSVKIDIPKDVVLQSGFVLECTVAGYVGGTAETGIALTGALVGEKYIHLVLANTDQDDLFVNVTDFVDIYTQGTGIAINARKIAIDGTVATKGTSLSHYGIANSMTKTEMNTAFGNMTYTEVETVGLVGFTTSVNPSLVPTAAGLKCFLTDTQKIATSESSGETFVWDLIDTVAPVLGVTYFNASNNKYYQFDGTTLVLL